MDYPTTERQAEFMALADRLAERFAERAAEHDQANSFPHENFRDLHEAGYLALTVPEEYGGRGADPLEVALAQERLARGDGSTALSAAMHLMLIGRLAETRAWPPALFARLCREVVARGALINSAASEPELGSPSRGGMPGATAVRVPDGWRINGRKNWTSLAPALSYFLVMAAIHDGDQPPRRGHLLVPAGTPGLRVEETWNNLGMRATGSHDIVLEDVTVPADACLTDAGSPAIGDGRAWALVTSAIYTGIAAAARDYAIRYARERRPIGLSGPIAELQTIHHRVAEMELLLLQSRAIVYGTAEAWLAQPERRDAITWQLAAAKYTATNNAIRVTDLAVRIVGSAGLLRSQPLERYLRDARSGLGHPPMDDSALTQIGKFALGL